MSVIYNDCIENKYNGTFSDMEGFDTGISFGNEYEQDIYECKNYETIWFLCWC